MPQGKSKSNVPNEPLRFSVERAGIEFGMSSATMRKRLAQNSAIADSDGLYTTRQITDAVFGGFNEEKLATQRQLTKKYQLENAITEGSVLDRVELTKGFAAIADAFVSRLMAAQEIPRSVKEDLLRDLASWPLVLKDVAGRQSQLQRANGQEDESEDA